MSSGASSQPKDKDLTAIARGLQGTTTGVLKKIDTDTWALDANLYSISVVGAPADSTFLVGNGSSWVGESGSTARDSIGLGTTSSPQFSEINLGHASDTTLARSAAGKVTIENVEITTVSNTQTLTNKTLTDPAIVGAIIENIYTITDGAAFEIDPSNGTIQTITLSASRIPKGTNFAAGESVTLMVLDGSAYSITWTDTTFGTSGVVWIGGTAPTLDTTKYTVIEFWKVGTQVYGALVGVA